MAHRPRRTFRQRQADSSDSDGSKDQSAESPGPAEVAGRPHRARGPRGRARVWASSRRAPGAAPRVDGGSGAPECRMVDLPTDEEDETHHSSESKEDQTSSSDSSSSLEEKEFSSIVKIPDAAFVQAVCRKRELVRAQDDYIALDVKHTSTTTDRKGSSDEDAEGDSDDYEKRIPFAPKPQTLRQRIAEETASRNEEISEESQEDENQDIWEQQQMRKAVKSIEGRVIDLSHSSGSQAVKKFDTSISFPPVNLEIIKKQLNTRLTLLQDTHRSHQREYEKYMQDIESSKSTIQNLESSSNHALSYKFYKSMKTYVENLIDCLNEKVKLRSQQMEAWV